MRSSLYKRKNTMKVNKLLIISAINLLYALPTLSITTFSITEIDNQSNKNLTIRQGNKILGYAPASQISRKNIPLTAKKTGEYIFLKVEPAVEIWSPDMKVATIKAFKSSAPEANKDRLTVQFVTEKGARKSYFWTSDLPKNVTSDDYGIQLKFLNQNGEVIADQVDGLEVGASYRN